jgi:uncharacterized protein YbjT (DUF2867 family)
MSCFLGSESASLRNRFCKLKKNHDDTSDGSTGMLGSKIVSALLDKSDVNVRAMVRSINDSNEKNRQKIDEMKAKGATILEGDVMQPKTLLSPCAGVNVVVSAIGNSEATTPGQKSLIDAAKQQGVKRFIPSNYCVDYRKLDYGDNDNLDKRKEVLNYLQHSGLEYTLILNGAFMDSILYITMFDLKHQTFQYWGDSEMPMNFTTTDDTAKYVAAAVSDLSLADKALKVSGDTLTPKQLKATYEAATGTKLTEKQLGTIPEMKAWIAAKKASARSIQEYVFDQYMYGIVSGKGRLDRVENDCYPQIHPMTVKQLLSKGAA